MGEAEGGTHRIMAMSRRSTLPYVRVIGLALVTFVALVGCVTPLNDYQDFLARTADARAPVAMPPPTTDASTPAMDASMPIVDGAIPEGGFSGTYYMACLTPLSGGDISMALSFDVTLQVTPLPDGGGSSVTLTTLALVVQATNLSQVAPRAMRTVATGTVDDTGVGWVVYTVPTVIPGGADPVVPGSDIDINAGAEYQLHITSPTDICAGFLAQVTKPLTMSVTPSNNPCIFRVPAADGALPMLTGSDIHCP
jgi:hypothetical protein